jgi:DMSO/TMAO reductase YedYZ molybdopterin-dependent catalytic subunit
MDLRDPLLPSTLRGQRPAPQGRGYRDLLRKLLVARHGHGRLGACLRQERLPAQVMQHGSPAHGHGATQGVGELLGQGQRSLDAGHRLVGVLEEPEGVSRLHAARGIITPSALHYELHHDGVPTIDPTTHTLLIHGLVKRPLKLTVHDLMRFPSVNRISFLECSGNGFREWRQPTGKDVQQTHGLLSGSEWTGVALSTLLREVGLQPGPHGSSPKGRMPPA